MPTDHLVGKNKEKEIFLSEDHGFTWKQITDFRDKSFDKSYINNIIISNDAHIIIGMNPYGIIYFKDDCSRSNTVSIMANNYAVTCMALNNNNILLVGTFLEGLSIVNINEK